MASFNISVKERMKLFEVGRAPSRSSPRSRLSPRQRLARLSPRNRFNPRGAIKLNDSDESSASGGGEDSESHPFNDVLSRKKTVTIQESEKLEKKSADDIEEALAPSIGFSLPPKSPRHRQPRTKTWNQIDYHKNNIVKDPVIKSWSQMQIDFQDDIGVMTVVTNNDNKDGTSRPPESPRHPSRPRLSKPDKISRNEYHNLELEAGSTQNERLSSKSKKPEWQLKRVRIMGNKEYESPLSKRKRNTQQAQRVQLKLPQPKATSHQVVVAWPDNEDNEMYDDWNDNENKAPQKVLSPRSKVPSLQPSGRDSRRSCRMRTGRSPSPSSRESPTHCMGFDLSKVIEKLSHQQQALTCKSSSPLHSEEESSPTKIVQSGNVTMNPEPILVVQNTVDTDQEREKSVPPKRNEITPTSMDQEGSDKRRNRLEEDLTELEAMIEVIEQTTPRERERHVTGQTFSHDHDKGVIEGDANGKLSLNYCREDIEELEVKQYDSDDLYLSGLSSDADVQGYGEHEVPWSQTKSTASNTSEKHQSRSARLRSMKENSPVVKKYTKAKGVPSPKVQKYTVDAAALKRNLASASIVIQDEKESSIGSGESARSSLSSEELSGIANRALSMSRVLNHTKHSKLRSTPLHRLLKQRAKSVRHPASSSDCLTAEETDKLQKHESTFDPKEDKQREPKVTETCRTESSEDSSTQDKKSDTESIPNKLSDAASSDRYAPFPLVSRSYRNTRLARRYLHRTQSKQEIQSTSTLSSILPRHAISSSPKSSQCDDTSFKLKKSCSNLMLESSATVGSRKNVSSESLASSSIVEKHGRRLDDDSPHYGRGSPAMNLCGFLGRMDTEGTFTLAESSTDLSDTTCSTRPPKSISVISPAPLQPALPHPTGTLDTTGGDNDGSASKEHEDVQIRRPSVTPYLSQNKKVARANALVALYKQAENNHDNRAYNVQVPIKNAVIDSSHPTRSEEIYQKISSTDEKQSHSTGTQKATDIFTRSVARRRYHPALAKARAKKGSAYKNRREDRFQDAAESYEAGSNSIFNDKTEIALTYWKYPKSTNNAELSNEVKIENDFATPREEDMHESHERDVSEGNALYTTNMTSDLTLSVATGSSEDHLTIKESSKSYNDTTMKEQSSSDSDSDVGGSKLLGESLTVTSSGECGRDVEHPDLGHDQQTGSLELTNTTKIDAEDRLTFRNLCYKQECVAMSAEEGCPCNTMGTTEQEIILFAESLRSFTNRVDVPNILSTASDSILLNPYNLISKEVRSEQSNFSQTHTDIENKTEQIQARLDEMKPVKSSIAENQSHEDQKEDCKVKSDRDTGKAQEKDAVKSNLTRSATSLKQSNSKNYEETKFKYEDLRALSCRKKSEQVCKSYDSDNDNETGVDDSEDIFHGLDILPPPSSPSPSKLSSNGSHEGVDNVTSNQAKPSVSTESGERFHYHQDSEMFNKDLDQQLHGVDRYETQTDEKSWENSKQKREKERRMKSEAVKKDLETTESAISNQVLDSSALMKLGASFIETFYSGICNGNDLPKEKLFAFVDHDIPRVDSNETQEGRYYDATLINSETQSLSSDVDGVVKRKSLSEDAEEASKVDSYFIPDIDDYSKDTDELESQIPLVLLEEVKTHNCAERQTDAAQLSSERLAALTNFASICKAEGIEVLKLNRRNKWQLRVLTVSQETISLPHCTEDLTEYPKALLWVKRFQPNHSYSLSNITSEGKGGVEFVNVSKANFQTADDASLKGFPNFENSVQLNMEYACGGKPRNLAFRFKTYNDAAFFASFLAIAKEVLNEEEI